MGLSRLWFIWLWGFALLLVFSGCKTTPTQEEKEKKEKIQNREMILKSDFFTKKKGKAGFRVYVSSEHYIVKQYRFQKHLKRFEDKGGDSFIKSGLKDLNKINEERTGIVKVTFYPNGNIARVRPQKLTFLTELDRLMVEDVQRWRFKFLKGKTYPRHLWVRYKFRLQKKFSDEKTLSDIEKQYLKDNPEFRRKLERRRRLQQRKKEEQ